MDESPLERKVTLHQLRILTAVVDRQSFTRAAEALSLSQPAVTHQMQAFSRALGHPLFQPARGRIELTPIGQALYERAGRVLALVTEMAEAIDNLNGLESGSVRVAGDTTVGIYVVPDALSAFHRIYPRIQLNLDVVNRKAVLDLLRRGEADLAVLGRLPEDGSVEALPLLENQLMCYCAPDHPFVAREPVSIKDLNLGPLLLREPGSATRDTTERVFREHGADAVPTMEMASNGALKRAVVGGLGVAIFSTCAVRLELALGLLYPLRVEGFPVHRMWHVAWSQDRLLSPAARALRDYLQTNDWRASLPAPRGAE